jgi:predicted membrane-bound spermidine synthase
MYETRHQKPLPRPLFVRRFLGHALIAFSVILFSIGLGMVGYCYFERLSAIDGFLNSAMLLGGMGPVNAPVTHAGKLFAGFFALYAGLVFIVTAGLLFTPLLHRLMHHFHWDDK